MFEKVGAGLRRANEAMADAQKTWRDEALSSREQGLSDRQALLEKREAELKQRLSDFHRLERRRWAVRVIVVVAIAVVGVGFFFAGGLVASIPVEPSIYDNIPVPPPLPSTSSDNDDQSREALSDQLRASEPEPRESSFSECVAKGHAYFREIEAWPTLSSGEDAHTAAVERCGRTTGAFG